MRTNAMIIFMFNSTTKANLEALFNSYGQIFENYNAFKDFLLENTGNYNFIMYDKTKKISSNDIKDNYKIMRCPKDIPNFYIKYKNKI
jgi:hypothetical protein